MAVKRKVKKKIKEQPIINIDELLMNEKINEVDFSQTLEDSMIPYSVLTLVGRSLPSIEDGLKVVARRLLWTCLTEGYMPNKHYVKSAQITGTNMAWYHPHSSSYGTLALLSQPWNMRYPLIDFQGNKGSLDGDMPASERYTEGRLDKLSLDLLEDVGDMACVEYRDNYSETRKEPVVFPALLPNFLLNGAYGIAVGYTTKVPSHNLNEICDAIIAFIKNNNITLDELMEFVPGPDLPLGGTILTNNIKQLYETGMGKITFRSTYITETNDKGNPLIVFTDIPPEVNKPDLVGKIYELITTKAITRCLSVRDESQGMDIRIVIECQPTARISDIVNDLYSKTALQSNVSYIMRGVLGSTPKLVGLKEAIEIYVNHRHEVINKRFNHLLDENKHKIYFLSGLAKVAKSIKQAVKIITDSETPEDAFATLKETFNLEDDQVNRVLEMKLRQITKLDRDKLDKQIAALEEDNVKYNAILTDTSERDKYMIEQLEGLKSRWGDPRRTNIITDFVEIESEDDNDIGNEVIAISTGGKVKRYTEDEFNALNAFKDKNLLFKQIINCEPGEEIIVIHSNGEASRSSLKEFEFKYDKIDDFVGLIRAKADEKKTVLFVFEDGSLKKIPVEKIKFKDSRRIPIAKDINSKLVLIRLLDDTDEETIVLATENGYISRFSANSFTSSGLPARLIPTSKLEQGDKVVDCEIVNKSFVGRLALFAVNSQGEPVAKTVLLQDIAVKGRVARALRYTNEKTFGYLTKIVIANEDFDILDDKNNKVHFKLDKYPAQNRLVKFSAFTKRIATYKIIL